MLAGHHKDDTGNPPSFVFVLCGGVDARYELLNVTPKIKT